jgi:hypothetical protein
VPRITAPEALITATFSEIHAASRISSLLQQRVIPLEVGELAVSHTVTSFEALKENTTMDRMGMYRNANPEGDAGDDEIRAPLVHRAPADSRACTLWYHIMKGTRR